jgi:hypothetical protein
VEQSSKTIDEEYIEKLKKELSEEDQSPEERKYKVRVTDKDTGNSYIRMANRSKINELRANPNIVSVEMLDLYGSPQPSESERTRGAQTASVAAGKGLKNNDGNLANNYPPYNKVTRGDVIAGATGNDQMGGKKKVKEEFIGEKDNGDENKQIKPMGPKEKNNCVKVYGPSTKDDLMMHQELEGEVITETGYTKFLKKVRSLQEMAVSQNQQQLAAMAIEYLDGNMPDASDAVKQMAKMGRKELKKFASTKHEGLPEKVKEEMECGSDDDKKKKKNVIDPREMETIKGRLRAKLGLMGLRMSYEPEGKLVDEATRAAREGVPETHRPGLEVNRRVATQNRETPQGRRVLASQAASRRKKQTPEEQEKKRTEDENFERVKGINKRGLTQRQKEESKGVRAAGSLGS